MTIKRYADDFRVEEVLTPEAVATVSPEPGRFALFRLSKEGLGTDEALERAARELRVPASGIAYIGLKDKHAATVQYIAVPVSALAGGNLPSIVARPNWRIERIGWLDRPLEPGDAAGNAFRITVRHLTRRRCATFDERSRFLAAPGAAGRSLRFVNYFGEQRFGSARHGKGFAAGHLVRGEFEGALRLLIAEPARKDSRRTKDIKIALLAGWGDWRALDSKLPVGPERGAVERLAATGGDFKEAFAALPSFLQRMCIEAYQGWLWNETARRIVERLGVPAVSVKSKFGALIFPEPSRVSEGFASIVMPLFSPKTALEEPWREAAEETLAGEALTLGCLRIPGLRRPYFGDTPRNLFVDAAEYRLGRMESDESAEDRRRFKRSVEFFLPRGSYGTVLIGALTAP